MLLSAFSTNYTRVLAVGRVTLALVCMLFATTDPNGFGFQIELDDIAVLSWLVAALIAAGLVWSDWWRDHWMFPYLVLLDVVAFVWIPLGIEPSLLAYYVVAPMIAGHVIVLTRFYSDLKSAVWMAIALNLICIGICIQHGLGSMAMPVSESGRRVFLLMFVSVVLLWISRNRMYSPIRSMGLAAFPDRATAVEDVLAFAMAASRADGGIVFWQSNLSGQPMLRAIANSEAVVSQIDQEMRANRVGSSKAPILFDAIKGRGLSLSEVDKLQYAPPTTQAVSDLRRHGLNSGISTTLFGDNGEGWLILTDIAEMNRFDLYRARRIAQEVARCLDQFESHEVTKSLELARTREAIARDLHDGVAQSLAGAKFWLQALRRDLQAGQTGIADFDKFAEALDAEQMHVRELIVKLRDDAPPVQLDIGMALKDGMRRQALHWRTEIDVSVPPEPIIVDGQLLLEIKQLIRECIANAVRHGHANRVSIALESGFGQLHFGIADNGSGFDPAKPVVVPRTIGERVSELGGSAHVRTQPGKTELKFTIPLEIVS